MLRFVLPAALLALLVARPAAALCSGNPPTCGPCQHVTCAGTRWSCAAGAPTGATVEGYKVDSALQALNPGPNILLAQNDNCASSNSSINNPFFIAATPNSAYILNTGIPAATWIAYSHCQVEDCGQPANFHYSATGNFNLTSPASGAADDWRVMYNAYSTVSVRAYDERANPLSDQAVQAMVAAPVVSSTSDTGNFPSDSKAAASVVTVSAAAGISSTFSTTRPSFHAVRNSDCHVTSSCFTESGFTSGESLHSTVPAGTSEVHFMYVPLHLAVSIPWNGAGPASAMSGTVIGGAPASVTISARDPGDRVYQDYLGSVTIQLSDGTASFTHQFVAADHGNFTFTHTFPVSAATQVSVAETIASPFAKPASEMVASSPNPPVGDEPCGGAICGRGQFPPFSYRPYASNSPFNLQVRYPPVSIDAGLCKTPSAIPAGSTCSEAIVQSMFANAATDQKHTGNLLTPGDGSAGWPTYYSSMQDPKFSVTCVEFGGGCTLQTQGTEIHVPTAALRQFDPAKPNVGDSDHHLTVIDQTNNTEYDLFHVDVPDNAGVLSDPNSASNGVITIGFGGFIPFNTSDASGLTPTSTVGEGNEGRYGNLAGRVRIEELEAALDASNSSYPRYINHALTIVVPCSAPQANTVFPADNTHPIVTTCADANPPLMGMRLHLNFGQGSAQADLDHLDQHFGNIPEWKKVFLRTLIVYGAIVNDLGSVTYFDIQTESDRQYTSMQGLAAGQGPWHTFGQANVNASVQDWGLFNNDPVGSWKNGDDAVGAPADWVDWTTSIWSHLEVLAPCMSQTSCP